MSALRADLQNFCPKAKLSELNEDALTRFVGYLRDEKMDLADWLTTPPSSCP